MLMARGSSPQPERQVLVDLDGKQVTSAVLTAGQQVLDAAVQLDDTHVRVAVPAAALTGLGPGWEWHAMAGGADGNGADYCPGPAGTTDADATWVPAGPSRR